MFHYRMPIRRFSGKRAFMMPHLGMHCRSRGKNQCTKAHHHQGELQKLSYGHRFTHTLFCARPNTVSQALFLRGPRSCQHRNKRHSLREIFHTHLTGRERVCDGRRGQLEDVD